MDANSSVTLSAPTSGPYENLLIVNQSAIQTPSKIQGTVALDGIVYLRNSDLDISGSAQITGQWSFMTKSFNLIGSPTLTRD